MLNEQAESHHHALQQSLWCCEQRRWAGWYPAIDRHHYPAGMCFWIHTVFLSLSVSFFIFICLSVSLSLCVSVTLHHSLSLPPLNCHHRSVCLMIMFSSFLTGVLYGHHSLLCGKHQRDAAVRHQTSDSGEFPSQPTQAQENSYYAALPVNFHTGLNDPSRFHSCAESRSHMFQQTYCVSSCCHHHTLTLFSCLFRCSLAMRNTDSWSWRRSSPLWPDCPPASAVWGTSGDLTDKHALHHILLSTTVFILHSRCKQMVRPLDTNAELCLDVCWQAEQQRCGRRVGAHPDGDSPGAAAHSLCGSSALWPGCHGG